MSEKYMVIVDYNLSRIQDVRLMSRYAREKYGLKTILIRSNPSHIDFEIASQVIDLDPLNPNFLDEAIETLRPISHGIKAVLPFSDNAVWSGARLAHALEVRSDSDRLADAAFSKLRYRQRESLLAEYFAQQGVFVPHSKRVTSLDELYAFAETAPQGFVLKPSCEGNNRGVVRIYPGDSLECAFAEVIPYLAGGLICEELIDYAEEYSFDGVGALSFVTEKQSIAARYPVENGQIVPALVPERTLAAVKKAGSLANLICGQNIGPFHNEIKFEPQTGFSAVVEPNRRPAGMKIWHLAEKVYGLNFFHLWIDQLINEKIPHELPMPRGIAAIRQLRAPSVGRLKRIVEEPGFEKKIFLEIKSRLKSNADWFDFRITAKAGQMLWPEPKDNAGFAAEVCFFSSDLKTDVKAELKQFEKAWFDVISPYLEAEALCAS